MMVVESGQEGEGLARAIKQEPPFARSEWDWQAKDCPNKAKIKVEGILCSSCGELITDRYIVQVAGKSWHSNCLRCSICHILLDSEVSCFVKEKTIFCKLDYNNKFGAKCGKCSRTISPSDWVRRARNQVYHLACFSCDSCQRQLTTGEEFGLHDTKVLCKPHYIESIEEGFTSSDDCLDSEAHKKKKKKNKRCRTTFSDEQAQCLQANFSIDSNPDSHDLERMGQITGLSKRVVQVWFQNCRARAKRYNPKPQSSEFYPGFIGPLVSEHISLQQLDLSYMYSTLRAQQLSKIADPEDDALE